MYYSTTWHTACDSWGLAIAVSPIPIVKDASIGGQELVLHDPHDVMAGLGTGLRCSNDGYRLREREREREESNDPIIWLRTIAYSFSTLIL